MFNIVLKICCKFFSIYLVINRNKIKKVAFKAKIKWLDNTKDLKNLKKSLNKKIDLDKVESNRFNTTLELSIL